MSETRRWLVELVAAAFPECHVSEAASVGELDEESIAREDFDLALIDLRLPDGSGLEILRRFRDASPRTQCVVVTVLEEDGHVVAALAAGAAGYLLKGEPAERITRQLANIVHGLPAISPSIASRIMRHFELTGPAGPGENSLSDREKEILTFVSRGHRNSEVAEALGIAPTTVASHIKSIYRKLSISSRAEASWHATRLGL